MFAHEREVDSIQQAQQQSRTRYCWIVNYLCDYTGWDWLWEPVPWQNKHTHVWPSQWHNYSGTYLVPKFGTGELNFHVEVILNRQCQDNWAVPEHVDKNSIDWTWAPHPLDSPYVYHFPSQHQSASGVTYTVPSATDVKLVNPFHVTTLPATDNWTTVDHVSVDIIDYSWHPNPLDPPYIYVFGNQWWPAEIMPTVEYHMPGAVDRKFMDWPRAKLLSRHSNHWHTIIDCEWDYSWVPDPGDPPYIYVFGNQWHSAEIMPTVEYHVVGATERKYMLWPRAELLQNTEMWSVPDEINQTDIDFSWVPDPGSPPYIYQFATQHQRTGGPQYRVPGATDIKYIDQIKIKTDRVATAIFEIDFLDGNAGQIPNTTKTVRYFDNYLDTLKRIAKNVSLEHEFVWICSSICDYRDFDFTWHPEKWQATMLHVFSSNGEKFGDTFFMHVPTFAYRSEKCKLLDWYDLNFVKKHDVVRRRPIVIQHSNDTHIDAVVGSEWMGPLAVFSIDGAVDQIPTVPMWRAETKTIVPLSTGASSVVVPRAAIPYIKTQLYDYSYIDKTKQFQSDRLLDIVFLSNGEPNADANWQHLQTITAGRSNRCIRVNGVDGRGAAYKAAADASETPWFFSVFAKLEIDPAFDFGWQPDRMQQTKHYIFNSRNPVNGLEYGHQGLIAYNKKLVLGTDEIQGLDFTLSQPHGVEPVLSGTAHFNTDPWSTWRTAFREVVKLQHYYETIPDVETEYRLTTWQKRAQGNHAEWSLRGAKDAVEYYDSVSGNYDSLLLTFEWAWLRDYFNLQYTV